MSSAEHRRGHGRVAARAAGAARARGGRAPAPARALRRRPARDLQAGARRARRSCGAPTARRCARSPTRSRRATPTPAGTPSASPPTACEIARAAGIDVADSPEMEFGFLLHDIGKVAVPDAILFKTGPLTDEEYALIAKHPVTGCGDPARRRLPRRRQARRAPPPRALGRQRLPRRARGRGDPARGARVRGRRHARRADHRPPLPARHRTGRRAREMIREAPGTQFDPAWSRRSTRSPDERFAAIRERARVSRTILVVDDDPLIRRLIATTLEDVAGFELVEAGDGVEALERAAAEQPAIVFLDIDMPRMDGIAACRSCARRPATARRDDRDADRQDLTRRGRRRRAAAARCSAIAAARSVGAPSLGASDASSRCSSGAARARSRGGRRGRARSRPRSGRRPASGAAAVAVRGQHRADAAAVVGVGADDDRVRADAVEHRLARAHGQGVDGPPRLADSVVFLPHAPATVGAAAAAAASCERMLQREARPRTSATGASRSPRRTSSRLVPRPRARLRLGLDRGGLRLRRRHRARLAGRRRPTSSSARRSSRCPAARPR